MPGYSNTAIFDHIQICKKFERGAQFSTSEDSVFALLGVALDPMRVQSQSFVEQTEDLQNISNTSATQPTKMETSPGADDGAEYIPEDPDLTNLKTKDAEDHNWLERIQANFTQGGATLSSDEGSSIASFLDSDCIPCGQRIQLAGQMDIGAELKGLGAQYLEMWKQSFQQMLDQINDILKMFNNLDKFIDICAFFKFINDFVCIPDLQRILSALMALLSKLNFDFGGLLNLVLGLIAPLLVPFLSGMVNMLTRYILLIIAPLECIIDAIQSMLSKLDYNVLFKNIDNLERQFNFDPPSGLQEAFGRQVTTKEDPRGDIKVPFVDAHVPRKDILESDPVYTSEFNLLGPVGNAIQKDNAEKQAAVEQATEELEAVRKAGREMDGSDPAAVARYREQERQAKENLQNAQDRRDLSAIGRINKDIDRTVANFKSILFKFIGYIREAVETVEAFFRDLFDELKKIMGQYLGGSGNLVFELFKKLEILQIIGFIGALISALTNDRNCDPEDEGAIKLEDILDPNGTNSRVWTDQSGTVHIEPDNDEINNAIDSVVEILGSVSQPNPDVPSNLGSEDSLAGVRSPDNDNTLIGSLNNEPGGPDGGFGSGLGPNAFSQGKGDAPTDNLAQQRLQSLIGLTGDDVLDTQIARTVESFTQSKKVTFDCPLQTSVAQAEQINQWINELNTESGN